jgi:glycosyltransferase involved in cell wall biosynthesis
MNPQPLLTIGMPVFNGERFLAKALDCFLSQSFTDFQILLSDNASTDRTEEIGRDYAARDKRIRYLRNSRNMGAGWNFLHVYQLATGKYYKQAAHDDFCEPEFLAECISALESDPEIVVSSTKSRVVDAGGNLLEDYECRLRADDSDPVIRFADLTLINHRCFQIFGVHRFSALRSLPPMGSFPHADGVLLAQLGLLGRFYESGKRLFISTRHEGQSSWTLSSRNKSRTFRLTKNTERMPSLEWWNPSRSKDITFPEWNIFFQYLRAINRSPLDFSQKLRARSVLFRWVLKYRRKLLGDFVFAADHVLWRLQSRGQNIEPEKSKEPDSVLIPDVAGGKDV